MTSLNPGDLVAERYRLLRVIGEGGMGSVWAAHHELIGRDVAIKVTGEHLASRPEIRERFQNEARSVGKLRHPNIIDVMDVGQLPDGSLYIVFELLQGTTLAEHLQEHGRLAPIDAVMVAIEVCRALEVAHAAGVVHRDLKPANIFLHRSPVGGVIVKVLDFGISKSVDAEGVSLSMTQTGVVLGTPQYMSFEQARGCDDVDLRTDIWGVGAILYELLSARLPFEASNYNAMLYKILHDDPAPMARWGLKIPAALDKLLARCFAKNRSQRYPSANALREALETTLEGLPAGTSGLHVESSSSLVVATNARRTPVATNARRTPVAAEVEVESALVSSAPALDETIGLTPANAPNDAGESRVTMLNASISASSQGVLRRGRVAGRAVMVLALAALSVGVSVAVWSGRLPRIWTLHASVVAPAPPVQAASAEAGLHGSPSAAQAAPSLPTAAVQSASPEPLTVVNDDNAAQGGAAQAPLPASRRPRQVDSHRAATPPPKLTRVDSAGF